MFVVIDFFQNCTSFEFLYDILIHFVGVNLFCSSIKNIIYASVILALFSSLNEILIIK
jgi:hypothetical protein